MSDIVITWPATRSLESYLEECRRAAAEKKSINFRVGGLPRNVKVGDRCYVVYTGVVRCYHIVTGLGYRAANHIWDPVEKRYWPAGNYIVRDPETHMVEDGPEIRGFQGWRYYGA